MNPEPAAAASARGDRYPPQIKYIVGNEACERFSFYGMVGILEVYLMQRMKLGADHATEIVHLFTAAVYFMPLFGGWLADRWLGRYWTILGISLFYCLGHGTLALFGNTFPGLYAGLALIAIGSGGIKPCVAAFVGDQFGPHQEHLLTKVYGWFYWSVNFGATFAFLVIPTVSDRAGYGWAFGIPGIFMALATLIFWLGTKHYVRRPPQAQSEKRPAFFAVLWYALTHQKERKSGQKFLDIALSQFPAEAVESARTVAGILIIFVTIPVFWALFYQSNSTWILQGNNMTPLYLHASPVIFPDDVESAPLIDRLSQPARDDRVSRYLRTQLSVATLDLLANHRGGPDLPLAQALVSDLNRIIAGGPLYDPKRFAIIDVSGNLSGESKALLAENPQGARLRLLNRRLLQDAYPGAIANKHELKIDGERMQAAGSVLVMILVPILTLGVYPWLERRGVLPTPLRRMSAGMVFGAASFVVCGFLQSRLDHGAVLSVAWQLAPYIVLEIGEVLLSATALEFAFEQAPPSMKSIIMSFWLMTIAGGNFLIAVFTKLKAAFLQSQSGVSVFYFYAILMFVVAGIFILLASRYRYRDATAPDAAAA